MQTLPFSLFIFKSIPKLIARLVIRYCLNVYCMLVLRRHAWFPVGGTVQEGLGGVALLKEVTGGKREAGFEVPKT